MGIIISSSCTSNAKKYKIKENTDPSDLSLKYYKMVGTFTKSQNIKDKIKYYENITASSEDICDYYQFEAKIIGFQFSLNNL